MFVWQGCILKIELADFHKTEALGGELAVLVDEGGLVFLQGDLGTGKTTLCRGLLRSLGYLGAVKSPTFTLIEPYLIGDRAVIHFDLYRLGHPEELNYLGVEEYFETTSLCVIEWPERGYGFLPQQDLVVSLAYKNSLERTALITSFSSKGARVLQQLETFQERIN